ncbi:hypothetical protein [Tuwongella immobilis]|uniref:Uncharacterized protein n=1 Tax=Tuwongella immobilis TaxID=692036 RepID=A0A6C2YKB3_9BACT|nr:hypothetical protein [Tuwongella immobilis]VIP01362.1 Uncharacterized protein OS=Sorangium cellulosum (strain So ce56) GN=sce5710 PE=4 SV=1 [Tuwongella immobilis]VTR98179.1 Uncharacterized protein OS=Sorangium cellulosum (strain So ce56) GN=sce5710 PE=4 SV=1 [Tuwongella immobilis]
MSEERWLARPGPSRMLELVRPQLTERQLRLFGIACCRHVWTLIQDPRSRQCIITAEAFVDGRIDRSGLELFWRTSPYTQMIPQMPDAGVWAVALPDGGSFATALRVATSTAQLRASAATQFAPPTAKFETFRLTEAAEQRYQCELLAELFGNPFRPLSADRSWRTQTVCQLADTIYRQQQFEWMPQLGDALMDAGCPILEMIDHCMNRHLTHVRGCWVLDTLREVQARAA